MLQSLSIQNYALINYFVIDFNKGFSTITGETGAGKSIIIGALSLILGQSANTANLKDKTKKCIVEGTFNLSQYHLQNFFKNNDIDYEKHTIIRREINIQGKSRAFVNDTPVNISLLKELGVKLIDIHSQHQNLMLSNNQFQLKVVDVFAGHPDLLENYIKTFHQYKELTALYNQLKEKSEKTKDDLDYYQYQYEQLKEADLKEPEQNELENDLETLNHTEEIKTNLSKASFLLSGDGNTILNQMKDVNTAIEQLNDFYPESEELTKRLESINIELKDIASETETLSQNIEYDPQRIDIIQQRLDLIYSLQQKHRVATVKELIEIKDTFQNKIDRINSYDSEIEDLQNQLNQKKELLGKFAAEISKNRKKAIPEIEKKIIELLIALGIPYAQFKVLHSTNDDFLFNGIDKVNFLFSANKKVAQQDISLVASGGELSRLMLSIKSLISQSESLPTIVFDEIDTAVSGDIADKMGNIMKKMSDDMQVICITHLPQIASKGIYHYIVYDITNICM